MVKFILNGGPVAIVQVIFTIFLLVLITNTILQIFGKKKEILEKQFKSIKHTAILILALGFLGQVQGLYNALGTIAAATEISPKIVYQGLMISFNTSLYGLWVFSITYLMVIVSQLASNFQK